MIKYCVKQLCKKSDKILHKIFNNFIYSIKRFIIYRRYFVKCFKRLKIM